MKTPDARNRVFVNGVGCFSYFFFSDLTLFSVQFNPSLDRLGRRGDMTDDSAEILFQSFLQEALVSSSNYYYYYY